MHVPFIGSRTCNSSCSKSAVCFEARCVDSCAPKRCARDSRWCRSASLNGRLFDGIAAWLLDDETRFLSGAAAASVGTGALLQSIVCSCPLWSAAEIIACNLVCMVARSESEAQVAKARSAYALSDGGMPCAVGCSRCWVVCRAIAVARRTTSPDAQTPFVRVTVRRYLLYGCALGTAVCCTC